MDSTALTYLAAGCAALLAALLPRVLRRVPISMPMVFTALGVVAYAAIDDLPTPDPIVFGTETEHLTEACVIVALFGTGLALDRPIGLRSWAVTWRLLAITMPVSIGLVAVFGWVALGLAPAAALLVGAALAPTDPVLASDVQVGHPSDDEDSEDEPRFALTSEAGLNDALAFPFTYAAVAVAGAAAASAGAGSWVAEWVLVDLLWRPLAGIAVGVLAGRLLARMFFMSRVRSLRLAEQAEGFVAIACTFLAYGLAELIDGYGFLAVFVCALVIRAAERDHGYHGVLHSFTDQVERLITVVVLVLVGGAAARGLLSGMEPLDWLVPVAVILVVRPLLGWVALLGSGVESVDRGVIAVFGVRGIGSLYYVAYALGHGSFDDGRRLWAIVVATVLLSVLVHGMSATPVMRIVDRRRAARDRRAARAQRTRTSSHTER